MRSFKDALVLVVVCTFGLAPVFVLATTSISRRVATAKRPPEPWGGVKPKAAAVVSTPIAGASLMRTEKLAASNEDEDTQTDDPKAGDDSKDGGIKDEAMQMTPPGHRWERSYARTVWSSDEMHGKIYVLSAGGKDCPSGSYPIKDKYMCRVAAETINSFGQDILLLPAFPDITTKMQNETRPGGCILHCHSQTDCVTYFNEVVGTLGDRKDRRYCMDYFAATQGACRDSSSRRLVYSKGTFLTEDDCRHECLFGNLHKSWCQAFEVQTPNFTNVCHFFGPGHSGDKSAGNRCYVKGPSSH
eukprot:TRINITY_DN56078_c0_g1_i1.p1 TRINITY_DN56078_c0_g1~~TRINITY_DN56078_c0_g1_i1.p1  ORF type:complete len:301 (-),score=37.25 TRINITY_DN56078_c0_g1_i1:84-986(-)